MAISTNGLARTAWNILLNNADAIVACSESLSRLVTVLAPDVASRIHVIHNGIDQTRFFSEADGTFKLPSILNGQDYVLSVAAFEHKKGHDIPVAGVCYLISSWSTRVAAAPPVARHATRRWASGS